MKKVDADTSRRIVFLSFVCSCLVVLWHAHFFDIATKGPFAVNRILQDALSQGFARASVPYFLVVFGFFLFRDWPFDTGMWRRKVASRLKSLFVPYVLWVIIGLAGAFLFAALTGRAYAELKPESFRWWCGVFGLRSGVPIVSYHLWFVRNIFFIAIVSPVIGVMLFRAPKVCLVTLFAVSIAFDRYLGGKAQQLFFVCLGAWLAKEGLSLSWIDRNACKLLAVWCVLVAVKTSLARAGFDVRSVMPILNFAGVVALWGLGGILRHVSARGFMESSFFVYCSHLGVLQWCMEFLKMALSVSKPVTDGQCLLLYFVPPLVTVVLCYGSAVVLRRCLPRFYAVLSGGRR